MPTTVRSSRSTTTRWTLPTSSPSRVRTVPRTVPPSESRGVSRLTSVCGPRTRSGTVDRSSTARAIPLRPCVAMAITSTSSSSAASMITAGGRPIVARVDSPCPGKIDSTDAPIRSRYSLASAEPLSSTSVRCLASMARTRMSSAPKRPAKRTASRSACSATREPSSGTRIRPGCSCADGHSQLAGTTKSGTSVDLTTASVTLSLSQRPRPDLLVVAITIESGCHVLAASITAETASTSLTTLQALRWLRQQSGSGDLCQRHDAGEARQFQQDCRRAGELAAEQLGGIGGYPAGG